MVNETAPLKWLTSVLLSLSQAFVNSFMTAAIWSPRHVSSIVNVTTNDGSSNWSQIPSHLSNSTQISAYIKPAKLLGLPQIKTAAWPYEEAHLKRSLKISLSDMQYHLLLVICGSWVLSNTMWPGPRPTCMPSFIWIQPTVCPGHQCYRQTDKTTVR